MANESEQDQLLSELSRHYDTLLWTVTSLWAAAIGGLLIYCWQTQKPDPPLALFGIALTDVAMYFAASFRVLRQRVHGEMTQKVRELHEFYASPTGQLRQLRAIVLRQWFMLLLVCSVCGYGVSGINAPSDGRGG